MADGQCWDFSICWRESKALCVVRRTLRPRSRCAGSPPSGDPGAQVEGACHAGSPAGRGSGIWGAGNRGQLSGGGKPGWRLWPSWAGGYGRAGLKAMAEAGWRLWPSRDGGYGRGGMEAVAEPGWRLWPRRGGGNGRGGMEAMVAAVKRRAGQVVDRLRAEGGVDGGGRRSGPSRKACGQGRRQVQVRRRPGGQGQERGGTSKYPAGGEGVGQVAGEEKMGKALV
jgi:hypothetical protein